MDTSAPSSSQSDPLPIKQLPETLINRIAAGEIIHRPASALKELLENALDAGSTSIRVTAKEGGLKLLQIQDNGCGINKDDLPLLAQRFATSKISSFDDLSSIGTYGFRGEALASISHVAELSVVTKTRGDTCAWKATYADGILVPPKPGVTADPKPCAGNDGTTIIITNLFAQTPTRLSALRSHSEEYSRILDVMTKYSIHNPRASFSCKKSGSPAPDLSTQSFPGAGTNLTAEERKEGTRHAVRNLYGHAIFRELISCDVSGSVRPGKRKRKDDFADDGNGNEDGWKAEMHFTSVNYSTARKMIFVAFVNHRLVDLPRLKRALDAVYTSLLPKGSTGGFVYVSLVLPPETVDVNVHPTKASVHFLDEEEIVERIAEACQARLGEKGAVSRVFGVKTMMPSGAASQPVVGTRKSRGQDGSSDYEVDEDEMDVDEDAPTPSQKPPPTTQAQTQKTYSYNKIRTSMRDQTLDGMMRPSQSQSQTPPIQKQKQETVAYKEIPESECALTSVRELRGKVKRGRHRQLGEILEKHTFVGVVDVQRGLSVVQNGTELYLVNHNALAEELFYQLALRQFGDLRRIRLDPPPHVRVLVRLAVECEEDVDVEAREEIVDRIVDILISRRDMLTEYFSLGISAEGTLESLPLLLREYTPNLDKLPYFLMRLGPQVDWTSEKECFETFMRELAYFYVPGPGPLSSSQEVAPQGEGETAKEEEERERWQIQHVLFPAVRRYLSAAPPKGLLERDVVQVADLPGLYKVFERC